MRIFVVLTLLATLVACESGPDFVTVQNQDTIEGYEAFLVADPTTIYKPQIDVRLEELYFEKAKAEGTVAAYDTYFSKFPEGKHKKDALIGKESVVFAAADAANTVEAWNAFLTEWPTASKAHRQRAEGGVTVLTYGKLTVGEPTVAQVNLAEDPKGPLNGWGVSAKVTNGGDKTFTYVNLRLDLLADDGSTLQVKEYPLVSPTWSMPATEDQTRPLAPGDTRTWAWTMALDGVPADWHQKVRLTAIGAQ